VFLLPDAHKAADCEKYKINMRKGKGEKSGSRTSTKEAAEGQSPCSRSKYLISCIPCYAGKLTGSLPMRQDSDLCTQPPACSREQVPQASSTKGITPLEVPTAA
jgi:hypothetical protein